ncbi:MAG: VIT and VWA domain-containing protein [Holophagales bacterium]|jgi:Ca-activated chloride channel family protein|nr:VIT and VWA domain-containing protein [Holophagales bacterium]
MKAHVSLLKYLVSFLMVCPFLRGQAGLLIPSGIGRPDSRVLSLREMKIDVSIARGYARVNVVQVFENHTSGIQEGTYRFALPPSATVGDFAVWDGLQRIPGVILEKSRARSVYQEVTRQMIDPGLLQQGDEDDGTGPGAHSLFSVTIAPIPAMGTKRLELQFQQEVPYITSMGEFRLQLRPPTGEPPTAAYFTVNVNLGDCKYEAMRQGIPLTKKQNKLTFAAENFKLDTDLQFRVIPESLTLLRLSAFRNPEGRLPDGLALAPWERPSEIPPERDGFFLLEAMPADNSKAAPAGSKARKTRPAQALAILFETSLSHRWDGLETAYGHLVRLLGALEPDDQFLLMPFDAKITDGHLRPATPKDVEEALNVLRQRPLAPGSNIVQAISAAKRALPKNGRIFLLTSGANITGSRNIKSSYQTTQLLASGANSSALREVLGATPLFTLFSGSQPNESLVNASSGVIFPTSTEIEQDLFYMRLLAPMERAAATEATKTQSDIPFEVFGGNPGLRHIYPVLTQPIESGALSGWIGRYEHPQNGLLLRLKSDAFRGGFTEIKASFPEKALEARDLPRRWARARVSDLLARIEANGERREWIDEVLALSKRYKFVTPYTAFLAAPRSLLRPRRIQPGDPVLRVECDPGARGVIALLPFGLKLNLIRRPGTNSWEGRFLAPEGFPDGRHAVRILVRDSSGATVSETKHFIMDGKAPDIAPMLPAYAKNGETIKIQARTDSDVVTLTARIGDSPPVPLKWDSGAKCSVGYLRIPNDLAGKQEVFFEAVDGAKNRGFARSALEVK